MEGRIHESADIGIVTFMAFPAIGAGTGPVAESLAAMAAHDYFQLLEITHIEDPQVRLQCQDMAAQNNKSVAFGAHPNILNNKLDLHHPDAATRQAAVEALKVNIDEAYQWNASGLALLSGPDPGEAERGAARARFAESLKELCAYSAAKGEMPILLEPFDRSDFAKNCLVGPSEEVAELARKVRADHPSFGILVDQAHMTILNETPDHCLGVLREFLVHAHVGNCVVRHPQHEAYGDNHPRFGIPEGENGLEELVGFLQALARVGYFDEGKKPLSFEVKPCSGETSQEVIEDSIRHLDQAWKLADCGRISA